MEGHSNNSRHEENHHTSKHVSQCSFCAQMLVLHELFTSKCLLIQLTEINPKAKLE